jgi:tetratricopeptide (TPR) repeat protein
MGEIMKGMPRSLGSIVAIALALLCATCADERATRPSGVTVQAWTEAGWAAFERGDEAEALNLFSRALAVDGAYAPALTGAGWSGLVTSLDPEGFSLALARFRAALQASPSDSMAAAGRAAVLLALGADSLASAAAAASDALRMAPHFVFSHRPSFTSRDLDLIEATAQAARGDFAAALQAIDPEGASGIREDQSATWRVNGAVLRSFPEAVLAEVAEVARGEAG